MEKPIKEIPILILNITLVLFITYGIVIAFAADNGLKQLSAMLYSAIMCYFITLIKNLIKD